MKTPTISQKQAKKALSSKKNKKETIKNVLAKPFRVYWPLLNDEDNDSMKGTLERLLPRVQNDRIVVPYKVIKDIPKEERKKIRLMHTKQTPVEISKTDRRSLVFGINDVTISLEKHEAACILVANDVKPRLLAQHLLDQAVLYSVPLLVVKDLREVLKSKCGIKAAAFAIKKNTNKHCNLGIIEQAISTLHENYPGEEYNIHKTRKLQKENSVIELSDSEDMPNNDSVICVDDFEEEQNYHLKRKPDGTRSFVLDKPSLENNFIGFGNYNSVPVMVNSSLSSSNNNNKKIVSYSPLRVKRLRGDKKRTERKMKQFKH